MKKSLADGIQYLKGIGPKRAKSFAKIGINTIEGLLYFFPRRYEDRTNFSPIKDLKAGEVRTIKAEVLVKGQRQSFKRGFSILEVVVADNTGKISCVWFNQPYLKEYFKLGITVILYGKIDRYENKLQMNAPEFEIVSNDEDESLNIGRIVPVYSLPEGITQRSLRKTMKYALDEYVTRVTDWLHYDIRSRNNLLNLAKSLINIHFPEKFELQKEAYKRLSFEEFFLFQLPLALRKLKNKQRKGINHTVEGELVNNFIAQLPFKLTQAQKKVLTEIKSDMASHKVMQRLLQGDVGSGKTVVATIAGIMAIQGGYQVAFMVPTEILARQHYEKIGSWFLVLGSWSKAIKVGLVTSSLNKKEKEEIYQGIKEGKIDLIIGTHALLEESVEFKNLGLVVIDEQHKFGVGQRALLPRKGNNPDILIMTATPIPRTLAITLYADLDISVIDELPAGRQPINTQWIGNDKRFWLYDFMKENIREDRQAYVVYPLIEESFALDLLSAKKMYTEFKNTVFKEFKVDLVHGRLKIQEQDKIMSKFREGKINILIATTVLEVGIDVSNASLMVIEQAERFGLSQLHQLRGRVGRGPYQSFCILVSDADTEEARKRLSAMVKYNDGFRIAEEDLKLRGPGEFFGRRQHGLNELKIGNPLTQMQILKRAREEALRLINIDPHLEGTGNILLKEKLLQRFPEYEKLMVVG
jgi:ATP-dependent DNA helicase RecG